MGPLFQSDIGNVLNLYKINSDLLNIFTIISICWDRGRHKIFQLWDIICCEAFNELTFSEWTKKYVPRTKI